jgi:hypothetical protein
MYNPASNNRGANDAYWYPAPEDGCWRYEWNGGLSALAVFNTTPGEDYGWYLTNTQQAQVLSSAGIPAAQQPH